MKKLSLFAAIAACALSISACGGGSGESAASDSQSVESGAKAGEKAQALTYKDGEYAGESSLDEYGGKIKVKITVKGGKIEEVAIENLDKEGKEKDESYGKDAGQEGLYKQAQDSVKNTKLYPDKLKEAQNIDGVDSISGATKSYAAFKEAVNNALAAAK